MNYFAIAVSGGSLTNNVTSANVGNRSVSCLKLNGQVFFPYTYSQIVAGVPLALAAGNYTFTILAFSNANAGATTIAQLYSGSPSLNAFEIATLAASVTPGQSIRLDSAYDGGTAVDLQVSCPPSNGNLYALTLTSSVPRLYRRLNGVWQNDLIPDGGTLYGSASLAVDTSGTALVALASSSSAGANFAMLPNVYQQIATGATTGDKNDVAIVVKDSGVRSAIANVYDGLTQYTGVEFTTNGTVWTAGSTVFPNAFAYQNFRLVAGPGDRLLASANPEVAAAPLRVAVKVAGTWEASTVVQEVNGTLCNAPIVKASLAFDSLGNAYAAYVCGMSQDIIGMLTNRSGSWANFQVLTTSGNGINDLDLLIVDGNMHVAYAVGTQVFHSTAPEGSSTFSPSVVVRTLPGGEQIIRVGIVGIDANHLHVMAMELSGVTFTRLTHTDNESGSWVTEIVATGLASGDTMHKRVFLR